MRNSLVWLLAACFAALPARADDPADDPLPPGAKVRFSVARPILRSNPAVALLPPQYKTFLAPTIAGGIRPYDLGTHRPLVAFNAAVGPGQVIASGDGKRAAVLRPGALTVVEVATRRQILAVKPPAGVLFVGLPGVSLSADGSRLAYGGRAANGKGVAIVWDVDKNELIAELNTIQAAPVFPLLSADGRLLVTHGPPVPPIVIRDPGAPAPPMPKLPVAPVNADLLRTAQVWSVDDADELFQARVTGMGGTVAAAAISTDGSLIALSAGDGPIDLFDVRTAKRTHTLLGRKAQGMKVAISPDGKTIASVAPDHRIQRWTADGKPLDISDPPPGLLNAPVVGLAFADNDRVVAWYTLHQFVVAWEAPTGRLLSPLMDHQAHIQSIAFDEGGKDLLTSGRDGKTMRWDLVTGALNEPIQLRPAQIPGQPLVRPVVVLSANGKLATTWGRPPASTEIFDVLSGANLFAIPAPSAPPAAVGL
ncbi:MAG TPA: hypothetical protein VGI99_12705, partial [Gemmataceae bacterium]